MSTNTIAHFTEPIQVGPHHSRREQQGGVSNNSARDGGNSSALQHHRESADSRGMNTPTLESSLAGDLMTQAPVKIRNFITKQRILVRKKEFRKGK